MANEMKLNNFKTLKIYQKSMQLSDEIYKVINKFPDIEKYAMVSQAIRAVTSISANIAEGNGQVFIAKEINYLSTALGSTAEVECWIEHAQRRNYISESEYENLTEATIELKKMIFGYMKSKKKSVSENKKI